MRKDLETVISLPDFGRVPPQSIDIEELLLGVIMTEPGLFDEVSSVLIPEAFYKEAHQKIYKAIIDVSKRGLLPDLFTVTNHIRNIGELESIGGPVYITRLTGRIVGTDMMLQYAYIIKGKWIQRDMIRLSCELQNKAFDDSIDPADLLEFAESELYKIGDSVSHKDPVKISALLSNIATQIEIREKQKSELTGVPSGLTSLDRITLGWQAGDLVILAARPSMGKSALAVQFARCASKMNYPTLVFSLEMTDMQVGERYLSAETGFDSYDIKRGKNIKWDVLDRKLHENDNTPLWIDDSASMTIYEFRAKVRRMKKKHGIKVVICDYLNLFKGDADKDNMSEKYGSISKMFKQVAKECDVSVIALAQLNRNVDSRGNSFPKLSDLRNSGEIEQDADIIIFPVQYKKIGMFQDENHRDITNMARIDIAKNRNGRVEYFEVYVSEDSVNWTDMDDKLITANDNWISKKDEPSFYK